MLGNVLNIVGVLLIMYSIYIINKDLKSKNIKTDDLRSLEENTKRYYKYTEDIVSDFEELIDLKLKDLESKEYAINKNTNISDNNTQEKLDKKKIYQTKDNDINLNKDAKKIMELLEIGLTGEEIAKKLDKGIREVDIIIKMNKNKL